ncbi:type II secretion system protein F [Alishewanella longhuensis]|uniref:Type II secretion system protein F n=1 Tax=Alishewanella longhuensis TaxID=1091037 RepID=A0ABQ3KYN9_9ALTE|nr:type II secretion system F family protein [Alishewanella longhuensis]GHG68120.1 type II secretion system protein F [Alishewanella longhuensis]
MPIYHYKTYNQSGTLVKGKIDSANEDEARRKLTADGLLIVELYQQSTATDLTLFANTSLNKKDIELFTTELALLFRSGIKLDKGLQILGENLAKPYLQSFVLNVAQSVRKGNSLSQALSEYSVFDNLYINMVKIAEETGDYRNVFEKLAEDLKNELALREKVIQSLTYPAVILFVCVMSLLFIFNYVVPNMTGLFNEQTDLPGYTVALLGISTFFQLYQFHLFFIIAVTVFSLWYFREQPFAKNVFKTLRTLSPVNVLIEQIKFNSAVASMLKAGIKVDKALRMGAEVLRTPALSQEVIICVESIRRGESLSESLGLSQLYPPFYKSLLKIGEESGQLTEVFNEIADRSRQKFYAWVAKFTSLLEPLLILVMGGIVGSVVVIMMLSISSVTDVGF